MEIILNGLTPGNTLLLLKHRVVSLGSLMFRWLIQLDDIDNRSLLGELDSSASVSVDFDY